MADVFTRIGFIKGATGATGAQGAKGDQGDAATIQVGTVTTVPYGQTANVENSGTSSAAVFDFTIPQGRPGQETTDMQNLTLGSITTSSASFPIPAVGETGKVLWGKVVKWFSDMTALVATKFNAANVVNNLTTTASGYALDARQGKELKEQCTFGIKQYTYQYSIPANGAATITSTDFGITPITGYIPIAVREFSTGSADVLARAVQTSQVSGGVVMGLNNKSSNAITATAKIAIAYCKNTTSL